MDNNYFLYVEDDPSSRLVMKLLIEKTLHTKNYAIFENSESFLEKLRNLPMRPAIIMLDIHVPPQNGFQLLALIRAEADYAATKVIALTASVMNEEVEKLRESGFDGAIGKPINLSMFPSLIKRVLDGENVWQV